ncbi:hypothetical protein [Streptomyces hoynatensis]|uniref:DUF4352 domain-containing protein n=1 Tax=Streptomyces hoynatensis TaxID=1141874 RepID=A0A3A9YSQ2_9ACTN|nr:hypothetical protein [Streptomyces hoynatensis]RKN38327.1 hypothetical protein D7294_24720 [Streptomyces hoynatensis]
MRLRGVLAAGLVVLAVAGGAGCSSQPQPEAREGEASTSASAEDGQPGATASASPAEEEPAEEPPRLAPGDTVTWVSTHPEDRSLRTEFSLTVEGVDYVPDDDGVLARLRLTIVNLGQDEGWFAPYGYGFEWKAREDAYPSLGALEESPAGEELSGRYPPGFTATGEAVLRIGGPGGILSYVEETTGERSKKFEILLPEGEE